MDYRKNRHLIARVNLQIKKGIDLFLFTFFDTEVLEYFLITGIYRGGMLILREGL